MPYQAAEEGLGEVALVPGTGGVFEVRVQGGNGPVSR